MTFFGSLGTAVQGINAQAAAIGHISDNVANASTIGYKQVNTYFSDLVTNKVLGDSAVIDSNRHMGVTATADFANRRQGQILRDSSLTSIAVSGNGFIPVAKATGFDATTREPSGFEDTVYYTRQGDFRLDASNHLVNSSGYYLMSAAVGGTELSPFVADDSDIAAVATSNVDYLINLPASAQVGRTISNGIGIVDSESNERGFQVVWEKTGNDAWSLTINTEDGTPSSFGPVNLTFTNGRLATMTSTDPAAVATATGTASVTISPDFGSGAQAITLNLGDFNGAFDASASSGLTQFATSNNSESNFNITQNGLLGGEFDYVTFGEDGQIIYNYTNGRSQVGSQLLLANFREPDRLDRLDGLVFQETRASGSVVYGIPGDADNEAGVGTIMAGALEQSTVDVSEQMTRLIVAQQAYSLNGQVITASDQMLSRLIDMKR